MDKLLEWLKANVKDGADMNEATALLESVTEVTPERAAELAKDKEVRRIIDAEISRAVERHDERFREEKLPKLIDEERARIQKELNPDETPEQKRIRELEERIAKADAERQRVERREALRAKAQELGVTELGLTPDYADSFVDLGDGASEAFESLITRTKEAWTSSLDAKLKEKYAGQPPEGTPASDNEDGPRGADYVASRLQGTFLG